MHATMFIAGLVVLLAVGALMVTLAGEAQQPASLPRIGFLAPSSPEDSRVALYLQAFRQGLRDLGYVEGRSIAIEFRWAGAEYDRLPGLAAELVRLQVNLIVAGGPPAIQAAKQATATIPIVMAAVADPVATGFVASLARPGGNITGTTFLGPELVAKRLQLLKQALPRVSRVAGLWHPGAYAERTTRDMLQGAEAAARTLAVQLQLVEVRGPAEFDRAFSTMTRERAEALIVLPSPMLFTERRRIVDLAARHQLPAMYQAREFVELGGLIAYGAVQLGRVDLGQDLPRRHALADVDVALADVPLVRA